MDGLHYQQGTDTMNLPDILSELTACGYACEAGALENNVAWRELERMAQVTQQPLWTDERISAKAEEIIVLRHTPLGAIRRVAYEVRDDYEQALAAQVAEH